MNVFREWRLRNNLGMTVAASRFGVDKKTYYDWERGRKAPNIIHSINMAKALEVTLEEYVKSIIAISDRSVFDVEGYGKGLTGF